MLFVGINYKKTPSTNKPAVTDHLVALVLLRFGQLETTSRKIWVTIALRSSEGCKAPACTGAPAWAEERLPAKLLLCFQYQENYRKCKIIPCLRLKITTKLWDLWGSEQPDPADDVPAHCRGGWTRWPLKVLPAQLILWFYESMTLSCSAMSVLPCIYRMHQKYCILNSGKDFWCVLTQFPTAIWKKRKKVYISPRTCNFIKIVIHVFSALNFCFNVNITQQAITQLLLSQLLLS